MKQVRGIKEGGKTEEKETEEGNMKRDKKIQKKKE